MVQLHLREAKGGSLKKRIPTKGDVRRTGENIPEGSASSMRLEGSRLLDLSCKVSYQIKVQHSEEQVFSCPLHTASSGSDVGPSSVTQPQTQGGSQNKIERKGAEPDMKPILRPRTLRTGKTFLGRRGHQGQWKRRGEHCNSAWKHMAGIEPASEREFHMQRGNISPDGK